MPTALVTGANRGLGLEAARQLIALGYHVLLSARDPAAAGTAAQSLGGGAQALALDVSDAASVARAEKSLAPELRLDALVNNAGLMLDGFDGELVRRTLETNYRGAVRVTDAFAARLAPHASIVMVSSGLGELAGASTELQDKLRAKNLSRAELDRLVDDFITRVRDRNPDLGGWPRNAYRASKLALNAFTRLLAPTLPRGQRVNAVCPGWVRTRMGGTTASRSVEQGARGIVWAATLGATSPSGRFFRDNREIDW